LFFVVELLGGLLVLRLRRFSGLPMRRRTQALASWRSSPLFVLRVLGDSLKATTTMMFMSHPSAIDYIGEYRACERPLDPVKIRVRAGALSSSPPEERA
jgi:hypothetical protein